MTRPNCLLIMTDDEWYPPRYETEAVKVFRKGQLTARESLREGGPEFHRHYAGSTACLPSRATLFTGQDPSLHGWKLGPPDDSVPDIAEAPSRADSFQARPPCQEQWKEVWCQTVYELSATNAYRRSYYQLIANGRIPIQAITASIEADIATATVGG